MKASELRIGNMVKIRGNICKVANISGFISESITGVMIDKHGNKRHLYAEMNDIEPITLTPDILLNHGFILDKELDYRYHLGDASLTIDIDDFCVKIADSWEYKIVAHFHELQNLYNILTGWELTVNL